MSGGSARPRGAPPELAEVYERYTPLLLSGLGRLAAKGYDVNPADALGVVHDFYVEALPGILERYDASRGSFATYLYGAFLHFARPRIVQDLRWRRLLVPFDDAIEHPTAVDANAPPAGLLDEMAQAYETLQPSQFGWSQPASSASRCLQ